LNKPITVYITIDLTSPGSVIKGSIILGDLFHTADISGLINYDPDWNFDSSTVVSVCSDQFGNYGADCIVQNFKTSPVHPSEYVTMPFSNKGS